MKQVLVVAAALAASVAVQAQVIDWGAPPAALSWEYDDTPLMEVASAEAEIKTLDGEIAKLKSENEKLEAELKTAQASIDATQPELRELLAAIDKLRVETMRIQVVRDGIRDAKLRAQIDETLLKLSQAIGTTAARRNVINEQNAARAPGMQKAQNLRELNLRAIQRMGDRIANLRGSIERTRSLENSVKAQLVQTDSLIAQVLK